MSSIDNRVVQMEFDNQRFERGISTSMKSLGLFQNALSGLGDSADSFSKIDKLSNQIDFSPLFTACDAITRRFSFFGTMADQLYRSIEQKIEQLAGMAVRYVKMLSLDQVSAGFDKYARKTEAIQTIINATGKDIEEVNEVLTKLNKYSDETSYDFVTMTSSIGKFTSAGVELATAEEAMEGIANWAAKAGVGPERAASAFYNMSQAIGTGAMKLQDWKSIENLNMATKDVKEQFLEAGVRARTLVSEIKEVDGKMKTFYYTNVDGQKKMEVTVEAFNNSLAQGWLNKDVILDTMQTYADQTTAFGLQAYKAAQEAKTFNDAIEATKDAVSTGWLQTFEHIFGNYEEAKVLWTNLANNLWEVFAGTAEARNQLLEDWHIGGGYEAMVEAIDNIWAGLLSILGTFRDIMSEVFPAPTAERLISITERIRDFTEKFKTLSDLIEDFNAYKELVENGDIIEATKQFGEQSEQFAKLSRIIGKVKNIFKGFKSVLEIVGNLFSAVGRTLKPIVEKYFGKLPGKLFDGAASLGIWITKLKDTIKTNDIFYNAIQRVIGGIKKVIDFFKALIGITDNTKVSLGGLIDRLKNTKFITSVLDSIANFKAQLQSGKSIGDILKDAGSGLVSYFGTAMENVKNKIKEIWPNIVETFKNLDFSQAFDIMGAAVAGGLGIKIIQFLKNLDFKKLKEGFKIDFSAITGVFDSLTGALEGMQEKLKSETIKNIAISVAILAGSLILLASVPPGDIMNGVTAIAALMGALIGFVKIMSSGSLKNISKIGSVAKALMKLSIAVVILSVAVRILAKLSWEELGKGLLGIVVILGVLVAVSHTLNATAGKMKKAAKAMIPLAAAVVILALAVKMLGKMDAGELKQGLISVVAIIGALSIFALSTSISKFNLGTGAALIGLAVAVLILHKAVAKFGEMDPGQLKQGLIAVGVILAIVSLMAIIAGAADHIFGTAVSFVIIGAAMQIMAKAIDAFGSMSVKDLAKGLIGMALAMTMVAAALILVGKAKGSLKGAAAIVAVSIAIAIFAASIKLLSTIPFESLLASFLVLIGVITAVGLAATILSGSIPAMLGLAGAITLIGASVFLAGAGLLLFAMALASLAVSGAAAAMAFVAALGIFLEGIVNLASSLTRAIAALGVAVCDAIIIITPKIMQTLYVLLVALGALILDFVPRLAEIIARAVIILLQFLGQWIGPIVIQLILFLGDVVTALADGIRASEAILFPAIKNLMSAIIEFIIASIQMLLELIPGIGKKLSDGLDGIKDSVHDFLTEDTGSETVSDLASGMESATSEVANAAEGVSSAAEEPLIDFKEVASTIGMDTGENYAAGLEEGFEKYGISLDPQETLGIGGDLQDYSNMLPSLNINQDAIAAGGTESADSYLDAISASTEKAGATGQELADAVVAGTKLSEESFIEAGGTVVEKFSEGLTTDLAPTTTSGAEVGAAAVYGAQQQEPSMKLEGQNFVMGFATGMNSLRSTLYQVAYNIGYQALTAAKEAINSNSPSKAMMQVGEWFDMGFVIGIENMSDRVYDAGHDLGNTALSSIDSMLNTIEEKMNASDVYEPTIRPVMDLTNVETGAGRINQLLNSDSTVATSALGYVAKAQSEIQRRSMLNSAQNIQNGSPSNVTLNITTQELSNSTVDYLVRRVNRVLGGKV